MPAPYVLPLVQVFQEFTEVSPEITNPLRAWIVGPNANVLRYAEEEEKAQINLGAYNPAVGQTYSWPHKTAGSIIDQPYAKLFIDDAKLRYFQDLIGGGSTIRAVSGTKNRIRSTSVCFASTPGHARSAALLDRDVKAGDLVWIRGSASSSQDELLTYVRALVAEVVAASVGTPEADLSNSDAQSGSVTITQIAGAVNQLELVADVSVYNALIDGAMDDVYTITVVRGSVGGDLTTAQLLITTASGYEYLTRIIPDEVGELKTVGVRGLQIGFDLVGSSTDVSSGIDPNDLVPGQKWTLAVSMGYVHPVLAAGGTYVGTIDNTYIVTVTSGGKFDDADVRKRPRVSITTAYGNDGEANVVADNNEALPLGVSGATLTFSVSEGLVKGDRFYVPVTARTTGRTSTLVLGHDLSDILKAATDLDLELYIKADIEVPTYVTDPVPGYNWETSDTELTVHEEIYAFADDWTSDGVAQPLPVTAGTLYIQYREWLIELLNEINGISDISEIDQIPGPLDPDNPLKWAVSKAVANCGGTGVRFTAISDPTVLEAWVHALALGTERRDLYSLVPLSTDRDVIDLFVAHVNSMSSETKGRWRKVFVQLVAEEVSPVVTAAKSTDEAVVLATIEDDPDTSGDQYTLVSLTSANAGLLDLGVQAGDLFRTNFNTDAVGVTTYDEYVISEVLNETSLLLDSGPATPVSVAQKVEIHHLNSKTELVTQLGMQAGTYGNRRVCAVWPDVVGSAGRTYPGYHVCAALAGLAGGVVPQQHLTNIEIAGFDDLTRTTKLFTGDHLDTLASYGVWIVTQNLDGNIITRDALTSDRTSLQSQMEMITRNVDSISYLMLSRLEKYIGRSNVVTSTIDLIRIELVGAIEYLKSNGFTLRLGGQLIDATIIELRQHLIQKDRLVAAVRLDVPYALDVIDLHLIA
jgi:hypothetical protein